MAAVAATATLTLHANTTRNWIGGTGTADAPKNLWTYANWDGEGNFYDGNTVDCYLSVTDTTYLNSANGANRFCCDLVPNVGDFVFTGPLKFYSFKPGKVENSTVSIVKKSGDWTVQTYGMYIGNASGTTATFVNESGNITSTANSYGVHIGYAGGATGIVENVSGDWTIEGDLDVASSGHGEFTQYGGSLTVGGDMYISHWASGSGVLTIKGGTVTVPSAKSVQLRAGTGTSTINLDGGTLVTPQIFRKDGSASTTIIAVNFNGGTLKANAASSDFIYGVGTSAKVNVGANGGVIDCGGYALTLAVGNGAVGKGITGSGSLTFTGGNTITLNCDVSYSGTTRVTPGTILAISNATAKANILGTHGLVVAGIPTKGQTIVTYNAALTASDYANISCPLRPTTTYKIGDDGMSIVVDNVSGSPDGNYWTGAVDNDLSNTDNWSNNEVPTENAVIYSVTNATLTKGGSFAPKSITFLAGSAAVTINGDFNSLTSVTNNSSVNQTFAGAVDFGAGNIDVTATAELSGTEPNQTVSGGCVVFAGGVKGAKVVNHSIVAGKYTLTTDEAFIATNTTDRFTINENSSLSVKKTGNTCTLYIREGATFNVENASPTPGDNGTEARNCLWSWSKGAYVVSNFTLVAANPSRECWLGGHTFSSAYGAANASAVLKMGTLTIDSDKFVALHGTGVNSGGSTSTIFIGEGGLNIKPDKAGYYRVTSKLHKTTLRPWKSDFTFGSGSTKDYDFILGEGAKDEDGSRNLDNINFTLHTDDEVGVPRTVTMDARIKTTKDTSSITVAGHGTNIVTSASPDMTGTYKLTDTVTVVLSNGVVFANGTISLDDGTTLEYTNSGRELALPCSTLVLPSSGKATLRINGDRLRDGEHTLVSGVSAGAASLLDVEPAASVLDGRRYEVAEKNGYLVLNVISSGMIIIFN
jgi:hypothetical protein